MTVQVKWKDILQISYEYSQDGVDQQQVHSNAFPSEWANLPSESSSTFWFYILKDLKG